MVSHENTARVFRTSRDSGQRLSETAAPSWRQSADTAIPQICVYAKKRFQVIEGFGGAFTEAAATTFYKLPADLQREILTAYFDRQAGHGYSLCRTHLNSCDFALGNYAYDDVDGDTNLDHFSIERDRRALIPMIREAMKCAGEGLRLFASPWSPPAWMKTNRMMNHGGKLLPQHRETWARYIVRYIEEYRREGIALWGLTVQNEPESTQTWDSCIYTAEEERDFVRDFLGPALERAGLSDLKLMIWDHNRDRIFHRASTVYDDPAAARYVWGTAFHWYMVDCFDNVRLVHDTFPDKALLFTEGCVERGPKTGEWWVGEKYAHAIIHDLNNWAVGWVDWNMLLDENGGPNHVKNFCSAPIIADTQKNTVHYQSSYYYIGHFSRFFRPGAARIVAASPLDQLETTACVNTDGTVAAVVLNRTDNAIAFAVQYDRGFLHLSVEPHGILTVCFPQ